MIDSPCDVAGQTPVNVVQKYYKERGNLLELLQPRGWNVACAFITFIQAKVSILVIILIVILS